MKSYFLVLCLGVLSSMKAWGLVEVGQMAPNRCFKTVDEYQVCLNDFTGYTVVYLFNAGWCGLCNQEFQELVPRIKEFSKDPVVFLSLSVSGWKSSQAPTSTFLREWKARFQIPFAVAASPNDPGKDFFRAPYTIPTSVVIDRSGNVSYKSRSGNVTQLFNEIRKTLPDSL